MQLQNEILLHQNSSTWVY